MRLDHRIFKGPLKPLLDNTTLETPENYSHYPAGKDLPSSMPAWLVQNIAFPDMQPGLVADSFGFDDSPDAEWISGGTNSKGPTSLALGRQGNLFMWGFYAAPQHLTESGKRVFLNSVVYISEFKDARPLVARKAPARERVFLYMHYVDEREGSARTQEIVEQLFPAELLKSTEYDTDAMVAYYKTNLEYLHRFDGRFLVDPIMQDLRISNRRLEMLDMIAARFTKDAGDAIASELAARYVDPAIMPSPEAFAVWLAIHRGTLYFSDVGGFRWFSPDVPSLPQKAVDGDQVKISLLTQPRVLTPGTTGELVLRLQLADGWHTYAPTSEGGFPLALDFTWPEGITPVGSPQCPPGHMVKDAVLGNMEEIAGTVLVRQGVQVASDLSPGGRSIQCKVNITVCDALQCLPPQSIPVETELIVKAKGD